MSDFLTVKSAEFEYEISKSKFIGFCRRVKSDDEVSGILAELRKIYRDCTHICYAYITDSGARSSDDGEPSGTAGVPIAECIRSAGLNETLVAVVRYFGGIKLGTGGLLRAYTHTAAGAIGAARKVTVADCEMFKVKLDYAVWKKIEKRPLKSLYKIIGLEYNDCVDILYAVKDSRLFAEEMNSLTQGKCFCEFAGTCRVERDETI